MSFVDDGDVSVEGAATTGEVVVADVSAGWLFVSLTLLGIFSANASSMKRTLSAISMFGSMMSFLRFNVTRRSPSLIVIFFCFEAWSFWCNKSRRSILGRIKVFFAVEKCLIFKFIFKLNSITSNNNKKRNNFCAYIKNWTCSWGKSNFTFFLFGSS